MRQEVLKQMADCWQQFSGSTDTKMEYSKVVRDEGAKDLTWEPPSLSFTIERHGAVVLGSHLPKPALPAVEQDGTLRIKWSNLFQMQPSFPRTMA